MKFPFRCALLMLPFGAIASAAGAEELWFSEDDSHFYMLLSKEGRE